jgi:hypothetical protein
MLLMIADSYYYWIFKFRYRSLTPEKTVLKYIYNIFFSKVLRNCALIVQPCNFYQGFRSVA